MDELRTIIELCNKNQENDNERDFYVIWEYIHKTDDLSMLELLEDAIPLGMLKYRLFEKINFLSSKGE